MYANSFGDLLRSRRIALRLSLRAFAEKACLDPGNASRLERGVSAPPESSEVVDRIAQALEWKRDTPDYLSLVDAAATARGQIPKDLLDDVEVAAKLPILFRTLRSKPLSSDQLEKLIESIRKA